MFFVIVNRFLRALFAFANYRSLRSRVFLVAKNEVVVSKVQKELEVERVAVNGEW
jgi:hypothetical protein